MWLALIHSWCSSSATSLSLKISGHKLTRMLTQSRELSPVFKTSGRLLCHNSRPMFLLAVYSYHDEHKNAVPITKNANDDNRFLPPLRLTRKNRKLPHHKSNKTPVAFLVPITMFKKKKSYSNKTSSISLLIDASPFLPETSFSVSEVSAS